MSTIMITAAQIIAATAIISEILVRALAHRILLSFKMELNKELTRLKATIKQNSRCKFPRKYNPSRLLLQVHTLTDDNNQSIPKQ